MVITLVIGCYGSWSKPKVTNETNRMKRNVKVMVLKADGESHFDFPSFRENYLNRESGSTPKDLH